MREVNKVLEFIRDASWDDALRKIYHETKTTGALAGHIICILHSEVSFDETKVTCIELDVDSIEPKVKRYLALDEVDNAKFLLNKVLQALESPELYAITPKDSAIDWTSRMEWPTMSPDQSVSPCREDIDAVRKSRFGIRSN